MGRSVSHMWEWITFVHSERFYVRLPRNHHGMCTRCLLEFCFSTYLCLSGMSTHLLLHTLDLFIPCCACDHFPYDRKLITYSRNSIWIKCANPCQWYSELFCLHFSSHLSFMYYECARVFVGFFVCFGFQFEWQPPPEPGKVLLCNFKCSSHAVVAALVRPSSSAPPTDIQYINKARYKVHHNR